jgi:alpha-galactosidase
MLNIHHSLRLFSLAASLAVFSSPLAAKTVKVFILAGQSNMEGQGSVDHDYNEGKGNLVWSMANSKSADRMKKLKNEKGEWVVRDDVQICSPMRRATFLSAKQPVRE